MYYSTKKKIKSFVFLVVSPSGIQYNFVLDVGLSYTLKAF